MRSVHRPLVVLSFALTVGLGGCGVLSGSNEPLTVYAAASLRDAFEELADAYTARAGTEVVLSFDASSTLREQIIQGAPADLFASADVANVDALVAEGIGSGPPVVFARNDLVVVVPRDNPADITGWSDLARPGLRVIAAGDDVPITTYATALVDALAALPDAPDGFASAYARNVVSAEDNVRAVLAKVELGEGDAAVVYRSDAASTDAVRPIEVPDSANQVAEYPILALTDRPAVRDFVDWLLTDEAQGILLEAGFRAPSG